MDETMNMKQLVAVLIADSAIFKASGGLEKAAQRLGERLGDISEDEINEIVKRMEARNQIFVTLPKKT